MSAKVFNLMLGVIETRFLVQHESCEWRNGIMINVGVIVKNYNLEY